MWYAEWQELVECGIARFVGEGSDVIVEEPIALMSILRHFEKEGLSLDDDIRARMQYAKGHAFEEAVLLSCTKLFRRGARVDQVFRFHGETPAWACQGASIVARPAGGTLCTFDIPNGDPVVPSTSIACFAKDPKDVENWMKSIHTGWCLPGTRMGPDLMTWLLLNDGRLLLALIQGKSRTTGNVLTMDANVTAHAVRSLIPGRFFSSLASIAVSPSAFFPDHVLQKRETAQKEIKGMLEAINHAEDCFTGARYNILRVIAAYPLDAADLASSSLKVQRAIREDNHVGPRQDPPMPTYTFQSSESSTAWTPRHYPQQVPLRYTPLLYVSQRARFLATTLTETSPYARTSECLALNHHWCSREFHVNSSILYHPFTTE